MPAHNIAVILYMHLKPALASHPPKNTPKTTPSNPNQPWAETKILRVPQGVCSSIHPALRGQVGHRAHLLEKVEGLEGPVVVSSRVPVVK